MERSLLDGLEQITLPGDRRRAKSAPPQERSALEPRLFQPDSGPCLTDSEIDSAVAAAEVGKSPDTKHTVHVASCTSCFSKSVASRRKLDLTRSKNGIIQPK